MIKDALDIASQIKVYSPKLCVMAKCGAYQL